jgi:hypothetical protein
MAKRYMDWTDWAGDHPELAEAELRAKEPFQRTSCEHEDVDNQGVCQNCLEEVEGWEPDDAQIFAQYGQSMDYAA